MLYELIATLSAGFAMAGIALVLRHLTKLLLKKQLPKWILPLFAGIGIFSFQIHQEYNWFSQMQSKLQQGTIVVKTVEKTYWYRPWTYAKPQIVRFMAVDIANAEINKINPQLKRVNIYLFERRMSSKIIPQLFDCEKNQMANIPTQSEKIEWVAMNTDDNLYKVVCK